MDAALSHIPAVHDMHCMAGKQMCAELQIAMSKAASMLAGNCHACMPVTPQECIKTQGIRNCGAQGLNRLVAEEDQREEAAHEQEVKEDERKRKALGLGIGLGGRSHASSWGGGQRDTWQHRVASLASAFMAAHRAQDKHRTSTAQHQTRHSRWHVLAVVKHRPPPCACSHSGAGPVASGCGISAGRACMEAQAQAGST